MQGEAFSRVAERRVRNIRLTGLIGEGGMGTVYAGWDERLGRLVAVKSLRGDQLDRTSRVRLEREASVLGRLRHPHICEIFDVIELGEEIFLVLEFIEGRSLGELIEAGSLTRRSALNLAVQIASGVAAAHSQGILHRDLKPSNILITSDGQAKILDFGLSIPTAALEGLPQGEQDPAPANRRATITRDGSIVGTVTNMSPEQARGEELTLASDVFSLGLVLAEMLTGRSPYPEDLEFRALLERARKGEIDRLDGLGRDLARLLEEMMALEPTQRPSIHEVVHRLQGILAKPARRWRAALLWAATTACLAGGIKYAWDLDRQQRRAEAAERHARDAEVVAAEQTQFLTSLFALADPSASRGQSLTARELLAEALRAQSSNPARAPRARARILDAIGALQTRLGLIGEAEPVLREGLGLLEASGQSAGSEIADLHQHLGVVLFMRGEFVEAEKFLREALAERERDSGPASLAAAESMNSLGAVVASQQRVEEAAGLFERALEVRRRELGELHPEVAASLANVAGVAFERGDLELAESQLRRAVEITAHALPPKHPAHAANLIALGLVMKARGVLGESERLQREGLAIWEEALGRDHPRIALACTNLGEVLLEQGRLDEAETLFLRSLAIRTRKLAPDHPDRAYSLIGLARVYLRMGRQQEAGRAAREALRLRVAAFGEDSPSSREARDVLGRLEAAGREERR